MYRYIHNKKHTIRTPRPVVQHCQASLSQVLSNLIGKGSLYTRHAVMQPVTGTTGKEKACKQEQSQQASNEKILCQFAGIGHGTALKSPNKIKQSEQNGKTSWQHKTVSMSTGVMRQSQTLALIQEPYETLTLQSCHLSSLSALPELTARLAKALGFLYKPGRLPQPTRRAVCSQTGRSQMPWKWCAAVQSYLLEALQAAPSTHSDSVLQRLLPARCCHWLGPQPERYLVYAQQQ